MKNEDTDARSEFFSEDPDENLRIENEILHLKLKAELGGELKRCQPLPPDIENIFLKNILELEHAFANNRQVKIFDLLGKPSFKRSNELDDEEIPMALKEIATLMEGKNIQIDFSEEYDARLKYTFITEELFEHETDDVEIAGFITHYIYEEFHPNHRSDIESRAIEFIEGWVDRQIDEDSWELSDSFILPDGTVVAKQDLLLKVGNLFASYREFCKSTYRFEQIIFELKEGGEKGMGHVNGHITFDAILEDGETVSFDGPFEIYMSMEYKWWSIFYFVFPGFKW